MKQAHLLLLQKMTLVLNPHGSDETKADEDILRDDIQVLNPHGSDETWHLVNNKLN